MKKWFCCLFGLFFSTFSLIGQVAVGEHEVFKMDPKDPGVVCPFVEGISDSYIPFEREGREARNNPIQFNVVYDPSVSFPSDLRNAFENGALPILSDLFSSTVPVRIFVTENATGGNTLASAGPASFRRFVPEAPCFDCWYPIALVEKLTGQNLNGNDFDLFVTINLAQQFYFDFENPLAIGGRFDFVSIVLHEIFHGMGFSAFPGTSVDDTGIGTILDSGSPSIYASNMVDNAGIFLIDQFPDGSLELGNALTSNNLFFRSSSFSIATQPQLYAPPNFAGGSSISHLDNTRFSDTPDELMTPFAVRGRISRDPGIALTMMNDMGWASTSIIYENFPEETLELAPTDSLLVTAIVLTDEEVDFESLQVEFSFDDFQTSTVRTLVADGNGTTFSTFIPGRGESEEVAYFFSIETTPSRELITNPGSQLTGEQIVYGFEFGFDEDAPVITHQPADAVNVSDPAIGIEANVSDEFTGVDSVFIVFSINEGPSQTLEMVLDEDNEFEDDLYFVSVPLSNLQVDDTLRYRIFAVDQSLNRNEAIFPETGEVKVPVEELLATVITYINNFDTPSNDFTGDFSITQPNGFNSPGIHSPHPYPEAGNNNTTNLIYELTIPILLKEELGTIEFDEIVLVEPGEPGTSFGDVEFWDFVAVEGKKVGTNDWIPFITPYDARDDFQWLNTYNSGFEGNISTGVGEPSLYRDRTIDVFSSGDFAPEDQVLIRFRLFSDPFAAGWGWAIDNLEIQNAITSLLPVISQEANLKLFPNPAGKQPLQLELTRTGKSEGLSWEVIDPLGRVLTLQRIPSGIQTFRTTIETGNLPSGTYTVRIRMDDGSILSDRFLKLD